MPDTEYLVFTKSTRWKFPGAKAFMTLEFLQNYTISYNDEENIALVPGGDGPVRDFGIYWLRSWDKNN